MEPRLSKRRGLCARTFSGDINLASRRYEKGGTAASSAKPACLYYKVFCLWLSCVWHHDISRRFPLRRLPLEAAGISNCRRAADDVWSLIAAHFPPEIAAKTGNQTAHRERLFHACPPTSDFSSIMPLAHTTNIQPEAGARFRGCC